MPSKFNRKLHFGKITGEYTYDEEQENPYNHFRDVNWFATDIPRDRFDQDILYSLGAFLTVCKINKNDAENRIKKMHENNWSIPNRTVTEEFIDTEEDIIVNIEENIQDRLSEHIIRKFKGHRMEELIEEILKAEGFTTYRSPEGADHGIDILASATTLGFGSPKPDVPVDRPTMDQLIGTMSNVDADYGVLVSWNGFKSSVMNEVPKQFFKLRLWDSAKVIEELRENYELLSDDIKSEIPLKRVWLLNKDE
ncbi:restriction endonuclease [Geomicrobium sediminis]|uniref:restriction endonuclease n=1 Tax=Geomicrobium sediminis TaxID=1347788 RepID=UPI001EF796D8|nr:restriction endonuclease [Geomicrobium sediminis]